ncbi:MAG: hypothetical protein U1C97_01785 [Candidatus Gracilibacteria bacterium]|nr:hypothetical protein [Candidatus Gracilibacteria bacterium]
MLLKNIPCNKTFYWSAATVDTGFMSTFATEQTFDLDGTCTLTGGGGGSTPAPSTGGGLPASWFRQGASTLESAPVEIPKATITISAFIDMNRNSKKDTNEQTGFYGLSFTASGRTTTGIKVQQTQTLNLDGTTSFSLPQSDNQGYTVFVDTGSSLLQDFEPTTSTLTGSFVLLSHQEKSLSFGFVKRNLLRYDSCLIIGNPKGNPPVDTDAGNLLSRLQDSFGTSILKNITVSGSLIDRRNFFTLLQRTHCILLETNQQNLITALKKIAPRHLILPLIDLPIDIHLSDSALLYSLLSHNIRSERPTLAGPAADLSSPITRREAVQAIFDVLKVPTHKVILTGATLPLDLENDDPLVPAFLTLKSLNILPDSFLTILGPSQGITPTEFSTLITRAAFTAGKISLFPPILDKSIKTKLKEAAPTPTFLSTLPALTIPPCLQTIEKRSKEFSFTNILPGDPLSKDIATLLTKATENEDKKLIWLLTGTSRPTEFGIARGSSVLDLEESPALLDILRTLLVLSCSPPETPKTSTNKIFNGSLSTKIPRDMISNLPRDSSFASRTLYKAEDHQREYELSFFSFAPDLLTKDPTPPATPLNLDQASGLLASTLLRIAVLQGIITPEDAEGLASALRKTIAQELLGTVFDWREENILTQTPFTRSMLIHFLSIVLEHRTTQTLSSPDPVSLGEIWWERVR